MKITIRSWLSGRPYSNPCFPLLLFHKFTLPHIHCKVKKGFKVHLPCKNIKSSLEMSAGELWMKACSAESPCLYIFKCSLSLLIILSKTHWTEAYSIAKTNHILCQHPPWCEEVPAVPVMLSPLQPGEEASRSEQRSLRRAGEGELVVNESHWEENIKIKK